MRNRLISSLELIFKISVAFLSNWPEIACKMNKKPKANSQAESSLEEKSHGKSAVSNDENASEPGRSRNFADCEPVLDAVLNRIFNLVIQK